jgi:DNA-binding PadR family transcriptional regulator
MFRHFFEFEGHGHGHARFFEKGDLKYVILDLLKDKPRHGYEIIRALEDRFHGFYSPSAGSVYPTLQLLDDMGYVRVAEQDGKKVYTITEEGKKFLSDREETADKIRERMREWWQTGRREEFEETIHELRDLGRTFARKAHQINSQKMSRIKGIITQACRDIEKIIEERE